MTELNHPDELGTLRLAERRLRESEERLRLALWATGTATWEWDVATGRVSVSGSMGTIARDASDPAAYPYPSQLAAVHPDDREAVALAARRTRDAAADYEVEFRVVARDGAPRWYAQKGRVVQTDGEGRAARVVGVVTEVTERRRLQEALSHRASHDPLTDLPNRTLFTERLTRALAPTDDRLGPVAVLFLDLDGFKAVNDRLGHEAGDRLLVDVGNRLRALVPADGTLARLGGDEFTILLPRADRPAAEAVAARAIASVGRPFRIDDREVLVETSVGIALEEEGCRHPGRLLRAADAALYRAKTTGRGIYAVFAPSDAVQKNGSGRPPLPDRSAMLPVLDDERRWIVTKVLVLLHKRADLTWDEFSEHWRERHRPIAMRIPGLREYTENHGPEQAGLPYGVAELYFDSPDAFHEALATPEGRAAVADLANFVDLERTGMTIVSEIVSWRDRSVV